MNGGSCLSPRPALLMLVRIAGKYVGTRPVKISKATTAVSAVNIGNRKAKELDSKNKKKSGTTSFSRAKAAEAASGGPNNGRSGGGGFGPEKDRKSYIRR